MRPRQSRRRLHRQSAMVSLEQRCCPNQRPDSADEVYSAPFLDDEDMPIQPRAASSSKRKLIESDEDDEEGSSSKSPPAKVKKEKATSPKAKAKASTSKPAKAAAKSSSSASAKKTPKAVDEDESVSRSQSPADEDGMLSDHEDKKSHVKIAAIFQKPSERQAAGSSSSASGVKWEKGKPIPYAALAETFSAIEATTKRLEIQSILSNFLTKVIERASKPEEVTQVVYLCINRVSSLVQFSSQVIHRVLIMPAILSDHHSYVLITSVSSSDLVKVSSSRRLLRPLVEISPRSKRTSRRRVTWDWLPSPLEPSSRPCSRLSL